MSMIVQVNATSGTDMEYIFSHSTFAGFTGYYDDPWAANQVRNTFPACCSTPCVLLSLQTLAMQPSCLRHGSLSQPEGVRMKP